MVRIDAENLVDELTKLRNSRLHPHYYRADERHNPVTAKSKEEAIRLVKLILSHPSFSINHHGGVVA